MGASEPESSTIDMKPLVDPEVVGFFPSVKETIIPTNKAYDNIQQLDNEYWALRVKIAKHTKAGNKLEKACDEFELDFVPSIEWATRRSEERYKFKYERICSRIIEKRQGLLLEEKDLVSLKILALRLVRLLSRHHGMS